MGYIYIYIHIYIYQHKYYVNMELPAPTTYLKFFVIRDDQNQLPSGNLLHSYWAWARLIYSWFTYWRRWFPIAMFVYQRVDWFVHPFFLASKIRVRFAVADHMRFTVVCTMGWWYSPCDVSIFSSQGEPFDLAILYWIIIMKHDKGSRWMKYELHWILL